MANRPTDTMLWDQITRRKCVSTMLLLICLLLSSALSGASKFETSPLLESQSRSHRYHRPTTAGAFPSADDHCHTPPRNCTCVVGNNKWLYVICTGKKFLRLPSELPANTSMLDFDANFLTALDEGCAAGYPSIRVLSVANNTISVIHPQAFKGLARLMFLNLSGNFVVTLPSGLFAPLPSLRKLNLNYLLMHELNLDAFVVTTALIEIYMKSNRLRDFPLFVVNGQSLVPRLQYLGLDHNQITSVPFSNLSTWLPNLVYLSLSDNALRVLPNDSFRDLKNLKHLFLARNNFYQATDPLALRSDSLTDINLSEAHLRITHRLSNIFQVVPKLRVLTINNLNIEKGVEGCLQNLPSVHTITMPGTKMVPHHRTFLNSTNILSLDLNDIPINDLDPKVFEPLRRLSELHLSSVGINSINITSLPIKLWGSLTMIDLSYNPFICDCSIVWFRRWLRNSTKTKTVVIHRSIAAAYSCAFPSRQRGKGILKLQDPSDLECFSPPPDACLAAISVLLSCSCILSTLGALLHRFRWHVRYWKFVVQTQSRQYRQLLDQREYAYDAFVIYSQQDAAWVIHQLRPRLENPPEGEGEGGEAALRLCIHQRDWLGGRDITENVIQSIESSRKCLLVVSNAFAASNWCHFEMTMAQTRLFEADRDNVIVALLEDIAECNLNPRLRLQLQAKTYIEWSDSEVGQMLFWARLKQVLCRPSHSVIHSPISASLFFEQSGHTGS